MGEILPLPHRGDAFTDIRGGDRTMRISLHPDRGNAPGTVVVSLWLGPLCRGSFRLAPDDLDRLISTLAQMRTAILPVLTAAAPPGDPAGPVEDLALPAENVAGPAGSPATPVAHPAPEDFGFGFGPTAPDPVDPPEAVTGALDTTHLPSVAATRVA